MLSGKVFYHGIIRKTIVAFGSLFSNIFIDRKVGDSVNGATAQRLHIPISYAPKEKWLVRTESDPNLDSSTYTTIPRISFEILSYNYDATRKLNRMQKISCGSGESTKTQMYTPVPYNIEIGLYILTKTQEDGLQILEQILPTFTPEYTLSVKVVPEMNLIQDVPVVLSGVSVMDEYDGDMQTRRFVTHTLNFTLKVSMFGPITEQGIIETVNAAITNTTTLTPMSSYTAQGDAATGIILHEEWLDGF